LKTFFARLAHLNRRGKVLLGVAGALLVITSVMAAYLTNPCVRTNAGSAVRSLLYGGTNVGAKCDGCCQKCAYAPDMFNCFSECNSMLSCDCVKSCAKSCECPAPFNCP
jgi:hypothetical protein